MSLEDAIERKLLEMAGQTDLSKIKKALRWKSDSIVFPEFDETVKYMDKRLTKLKGEGFAIKAVYSQTPDSRFPDTFYGMVTLVVDEGGKETDIFQRGGSFHGRNGKFPSTIDRVAISPGRKVAFEYNGFEECPEPVIKKEIRCGMEYIISEYQAYQSERLLFIVDSRGNDLREISVPDPELGLERIENHAGVVVKEEPKPYCRGVLLMPRWIDDDTLEVVWRGYGRMEESVLNMIGKENPYFHKTVSNPLICTITLKKDNQVQDYQFREVKR